MPRATIDLDLPALTAGDLAEPASPGPITARPLPSTPTPGPLWLPRAGIAVVAAALLTWAFAPFVLRALDAADTHRIFTGVAGYFPWDGLQYLAFVRDAHDGLIRNLFGLSGGAVFVHPIWSLTGVVQGLTGVGSVAIMAFWKIASVAVLLAGTARLAARHIPAGRPGRRTTALVLCLFGGFTPLVFVWGMNITEARGAAIDLIPAATLWDYAPIAIAIGLMPFAIEGAERILAGTASRATALWTAACCLTIGWLHPWQAATLMLVWLGLLLWRVYDGRGSGSATSRLVGAAGTTARQRLQLAWLLLATAVAPIYYASLSHLDYSWAQFAKTDARDLLITWPALVYCVAPLVVVALACARLARRGRVPRSLIVWPLATVVVVALTPPEQYHALDGLMLPLGVLVVRVWPTGRGFSLSRLGAIVALVAMAATFAVFADSSLRAVGGPVMRKYAELAPSDVRATILAARAAGGRPILSAPELGSAIPMLVDAPTWVGNLFWTPGGGARATAATSLFEGMLVARDERAFVLSTGARALVEPCGYTAHLAAALAPLGFREARVGCAHLFLRP